MELTPFHTVLDNLFMCLGFDKNTWHQYEFLDRIEFKYDNFDRNQADLLSLPILNDLVKVFKESINLQINLGEISVFTLSKDTDEESLNHLKKYTKNSPTVNLSITIDKKLLASLYYEEFVNQLINPAMVYLYLNEDRFTSYIKNCSLPKLETEVWKRDPKSNILFLLPGLDIKLIGPRIAILGKNKICQQSISAVNDWDKSDLELSKQAYNLCRNNLKWQDSWIEFLTPWHLFLNNFQEDGTDIYTNFQILFEQLFLFFTADYSYKQMNSNGTFIFSKYTTPDKNIDIKHESSFHSEQHFDILNLKNIIDWIYDLQWSIKDRLTLAQHNIIDQLYLADEDERFDIVVTKSKIIKNNIDWHWETFTQKNINSYMGVVKDLENYLSEVMEKFSSNIETIQKTLADTMLAAVAVIIGSFIAALFQQQFNPIIFRIGLLAYSVYMLVFPLLINMSSHWKTYTSFNEQTNNRKNQFLDCLPSTKVAELWKNWSIEKISDRFRRTFWWTSSIYLIIIISLIVFAFLGPNFLIGGQNSSSNNYLVSPTLCSTYYFTTPTIQSAISTINAVPTPALQTDFP